MIALASQSPKSTPMDLKCVEYGTKWLDVGKLWDYRNCYDKLDGHDEREVLLSSMGRRPHPTSFPPIETSRPTTRASPAPRSAAERSGVGCKRWLGATAP